MTIPKFIIPLLVVATLFGGYFLRTALTQPTTAMTVGAGKGQTLDCVVQGVKCKGTAGFFAARFEGVSGINGIETFAADHRVVFTYDPALITPERIREIAEAPVELENGEVIEVFQVQSMK